MKNAVPATSEYLFPKLKLEFRSSIAVREWSDREGSFFYLSLIYSEIDDRVSSFRDKLPGAANPLRHLELTDALIQFSGDKDVNVYRGGSCTFPLYWKTGNNLLFIASQLPISGHQNFSRRNFVSFFANVSLQSAYEPNCFASTPLGDWKRLRRGTATFFKDNVFVGEEIFLHESLTKVTCEDEMVELVQCAFNSYGTSQKHGKSSVLELSGGFDSTLAAAAAPALLPSMHGVSVEFPYYEFRFEAEVQEEVGRELRISRSVLDGTDAFPYSAVDEVFLFDEPTVFVTGLRHAEQVAQFARSRDASFLYIGHGGDQLFATDLQTTDPVSNLRFEKGLFSREAQHTLASAYNIIKGSPWLQRASACFVYDACIDVWMNERYGLTVRTPFTDLKMFKVALCWSDWCKQFAARPDKSILARSMQEILPDAVLNRKGKVAYDGVWLRGYMKHADHISSVFDQTSSVLEHIGLSPRWLINRVKDIASLQASSSAEIVAAYAISHWLLSWDIRRVEDVNWIN